MRTFGESVTIILNTIRSKVGEVDLLEVGS